MSGKAPVHVVNRPRRQYGSFKAAGINAAQVYYDMANAFACGSFDDQDEVLKYRCPENYKYWQKPTGRLS